VDVDARVREGESAGVRVNTFALLAEGRASSTLSADLARLRREQRLARDTWVTIWGLRSVHQFLRLPPADTADLEAMSLREAQHELSALEADAGRAAVALMIGADVHVGTHRRREVSLTAVAEAEIARQIQPLVDAGFKVRGVCTPAMALAAVARHHARAKSAGTAAYVALESNAMCVTIVRDGVLLFAREIPGEFADSADAVRERLNDELRRSLRFFRQSFRSVVERVVLCGGIPNLRALTSSATSALNVPVETLDSLSGIDAAAVPEPADTFRATIAALWPAIAIASESGDQPNLLRATIRVVGQKRAAMVSIVVALIAGVMAGFTWYFFAAPAQDSGNRPVPASPPRAISVGTPSVVPQPPPRDQADAVAPEPNLVVTSILYSSQRRLAIVNGRIVRVGDRVGSSTILYIEPRAVTVQTADGAKWTFELRSR